jgi:hypothetical protein
MNYFKGLGIIISNRQGKVQNVVVKKNHLCDIQCQLNVYGTNPLKIIDIGQ